MSRPAPARSSGCELEWSCEMRLVSYKADGAFRAGLVTANRLVDLERAGAALGVALGADILDVLALEGRATEVLRQIETGAQAGAVESSVLDESALGPAIPKPGKLLCLAGNYQSHLTEGGGQGVNKAE